MTPILIGVLAVLGMLSVAAGVMVPAYLRQRIPWKKTPGGHTYHAVGTTSVAVLDVRIMSAFILLREHADFSAETLLRAQREVKIIIQRVNQWSSPLHGTNVAGLARGTTIDVGANLAALCHELAHVCEFIEGGAEKQDATHASWAKRGIQRAVDEYEAMA